MTACGAPWHPPAATWRPCARSPFELSGSLTSWTGDITLDIAPHALRGQLAIGTDGFPVDAFFHDDSVPFTLTAAGESTLTGFLNLRHITTGTAP